MKKLLLILLCLPLLFNSCTNHYKEAEIFFNKGISEESEGILDQAIVEINLIEHNHKNYDMANMLRSKIDSIKEYWTIIDSVEQAKKKKALDSIRIIEEYQAIFRRDNPEVMDFLERFYSPGDSLNDLSTFKLLIHQNALYSKERMKLTRKGDWDGMRYLGVKSIEYTSQFIEVLVYTNYHLYETGSFYNLERLKLLDIDNTLKMKEWSDIGLYKMIISQYDGLENYSEVDVYNRIRSDFYLNKNQEDTLVKSWYENNKISSESRYKFKKLNGLCKKWRVNGDLWYEYNYRNGKLDGLFRMWHPNGQLRDETNYKRGQRDGSFRKWYPNGQLDVVWSYKDGKMDGLQKSWNEYDQVYSSYLYKDGEFIKHLKSNHDHLRNEESYSEEENNHGYVNVQNLNFRRTAEIKDNNIIGKLFSGQKVVILNTIQSDVDSRKGLLKTETIVQYKGKEIKFQPNKSIEIINTLNKTNKIGQIVDQSFECRAMINEDEYVLFNVDASSLEFISIEDWVQIKTTDGLTGYVYSRFITNTTID